MMRLILYFFVVVVFPLAVRCLVPPRSDVVRPQVGHTSDDDGPIVDLGYGVYRGVANSTTGLDEFKGYGV